MICVLHARIKKVITLALANGANARIIHRAASIVGISANVKAGNCLSAAGRRRRHQRNKWYACISGNQ